MRPEVARARGGGAGGQGSLALDFAVLERRRLLAAGAGALR